MDNVVTVEEALTQGILALQQIERNTEGTPLAGFAYAAALLSIDILNAITDTGAESTEEEN